MLRSKTFVKVSSKGGVSRVVREHYLRDDIGCGVKGCMSCQAVAGVVLLDPVEGQQSVHRLLGERLVIPDTNIFLHHVRARGVHAANGPASWTWSRPRPSRTW